MGRKDNIAPEFSRSPWTISEVASTRDGAPFNASTARTETIAHLAMTAPSGVTLRGISTSSPACLISPVHPKRIGADTLSAP